MKKFVFAFAFASFACGAHPAPPISSGINPNPEPVSLREKEHPSPTSQKNRLYYFRHGCDDVEIRNFRVENSGRTEKERRREGNVYLWEVVCGDRRVLRCTKRHVLRCAWNKTASQKEI